MGKKRLSDQQQLINFAMSVDENVLGAAIESLIAIAMNRFPKRVVKPAAPRKARSDKGNKRGLPDASKVDGDNGGE